MRRWLAKLGPTWAASPLRRCVQAACFALFCVLFFWVPWPGNSTDLGASRQNKEFIDAEIFLALDPLVSLTAAVAARAWVWSLAFAGGLLAVSLLVPRAFCGYICPMGTLIDLFDRLVGRRVTRLRVQRGGWWVDLRYYLLGGLLLAAAFGVVLTGFLAAIPVLTRGMAFLVAPVQTGMMRGWHTVPPLHAGHYISIGLFGLVLGLGSLRPRFWCRHVCPSGAVFSLVNRLRLTQRQVTPACAACGQCVESCPFDAIHDDFKTRGADCAFCQTCGGVCPVGAIEFAPRWSQPNPRLAKEVARADGGLSRRAFLVSAAASGTVVVGARTVLGAGIGKAGAVLPVRAPGSVPEQTFLQMCIRCQECVRACPTGLLQPVRFEQGLEGFWSPRANTDWAGCDPTCNNCGQVCPTGAIRPLPLEEKKAARMGLAAVDLATCLPHAGRDACQLCVDACKKTGHEAIEFVLVGASLTDEGMPADGSGLLAPSVLAEKCVGCGLCQARCYHVNVEQKGLLRQAAIRVETGDGKEDRLARGSYVLLRDQRRLQREAERKTSQPDAGSYLPDFLQ